MNTESDLIPGDLVQMDKDCTNFSFRHCVMIVTEVKSWGVVGHISVPGGMIPYREEHGKFKRVGNVDHWDE
jgi:hypothetical protein